MTSQESQRPLDRALDGVSGMVGAIATDLHATFMNVAYGNGQAVPPPYVAGRAGTELEAGLSDLVGGSLDALREQLTGQSLEGRLDEMRNGLASQEQEQEYDRGQEHGR